MKAISVKGISQLKGSLVIQGSKNTVLPIMASSLLVNGITIIENCPDIADVHVMRELLHCLHVKSEYNNHKLVIDTTNASYEILPYSLTKQLRSSVLLIGPMLAKWQRAEIGLPGGCNIGTRPIDIHLEGFIKMNVDVSVYHEVLTCETFYLQGTDYKLSFPSVGATENLLMAAVGAKGITVLRGVAVEPEIVELCNHLKKMGVLLEGIGSNKLIVKGTGCLCAVTYHNVYDRIVAGTYILMSACVPSSIQLYSINDICYIKNVLEVAEKLGVSAVWENGCLHLESSGVVQGGDYETGVYPAFPTDLQPVLMVVLTKACGDSSILEQVFEKRLGIVKDLNEMGANIERTNQNARIHKGRQLIGRTVKATDLRQGAALVVAGLIGKGYTTVTNIYFIQRGYEDIVSDLQKLGADISYV